MGMYYTYKPQVQNMLSSSFSPVAFLQRKPGPSLLSLPRRPSAPAAASPKTTGPKSLGIPIQQGPFLQLQATSTCSSTCVAKKVNSQQFFFVPIRTIQLPSQTKRTHRLLRIPVPIAAAARVLKHEVGFGSNFLFGCHQNSCLARLE